MFNLLFEVNFAPGIWLMSLFVVRVQDEVELSRSDCSGDYNQSFVYMLIAQFNYFIWPFIVLCLLNLLIMMNIWRRTRRISRMMSFSSSASPRRDRRRRRRNGEVSSVELASASECRRRSVLVGIGDRLRCHLCRPVGRSSLSMRKCVVQFHRDETFIVEENVPSEIDVCQSMIEKPVLSLSPRADCRIVRDRRAARSLFILVLVFLIFLFPYVVCATLSTAGWEISPSLFSISFWLLWLNSTCNPFLYPFIQMKYRRAYLKLFESSFSCLR